MTAPDVRTPGGNRASADHGNDGNEADSAPTVDAAQVERYATLRARLAVAGWVLSIDGDPAAPSFIAGRWGRHIALRDLGSVETFLATVGGRS